MALHFKTRCPVPQTLSKSRQSPSHIEAMSGFYFTLSTVRWISRAPSEKLCFLTSLLVLNLVRASHRLAIHTPRVTESW